jgi:hypothetical protein
MERITQADLKRMAQGHQENAAVAAILTSLMESEQIAKQGLAYLEARTGVVRAAIAGEPGFTVSLDQSDLVTNSHKMAAALERIASNYMTLASVLQALGEDVAGY